MKEKDLSLIKRYSIVEYLEKKGIRPVRRTPAYAMYRSPFREETHPSFKVDREKNLWIETMPKEEVEVSSTSVCAWRAVRSRKPSAVWGRTLPIIQRTAIQRLNPVLVSTRQLQDKQAEQGD